MKIVELLKIVLYIESQKCNEYKSRREQITVTGNTIVVLQMRK